MGLNIGGSPVADVRVGAAQAAAVYAGATKVWPAAGGGDYFGLADSLGAVFAQNGQYDAINGTDLFAGDRRYELSAITGPPGAGDAIHNYTTTGVNDTWQGHNLTGMSTTDTVLTMCGFSYMDIAATWYNPDDIDNSYPTNISTSQTRVGNLRLVSTPRFPGRAGIGAFVWDNVDVWDTYKLIRVDNSDYAPFEWCFFYASVEQPGTYSAGVYSSTTGWIRQTGTTPTDKSIASLSRLYLGQGRDYYHVAGWCVFPTRLTDTDIDALLAAGTSA